jgi:hypothetical protein
MSMQEGFISSSLVSFERALSKPRTPAPSTLPRRSSRLTKKAMHRTPTVAATQNVLMRKLAVTDDGELQSSDFEKYLQMFREGLTEQ